MTRCSGANTPPAVTFLAYAVLSWSMMLLYFGRSYHPVHSESYGPAAAVAPTVAA